MAMSFQEHQTQAAKEYLLKVCGIEIKKTPGLDKLSIGVLPGVNLLDLSAALVHLGASTSDIVLEDGKGVTIEGRKPLQQLAKTLDFNGSANYREKQLGS